MEYNSVMIFDFLLKALRKHRDDTRKRSSIEDATEDQSFDPDNPFPEIVVVEFKDVLDLHSIPPNQVRAVVEDYLEQARDRGARWVRIIHGKGIGVQRNIVRSILARTS